MTRSGYTGRALLLMDEAGLPGEEIPGGGSSRLLSIIEDQFLGAWSLVARSCPLAFLDRVSFSRNLPVHDISLGTGHVIVPGDFFRLSSFRLLGWRRAVHEVHPGGSAMALMQVHRYARGGVVRPVVVSCNVVDDEGVSRPALRYYSLPAGAPAFIEEAFYVPLHAPLSSYDAGDDIGVDARLEDALIHAGASLSYGVTGNHGMAGELLKVIPSLLPGWHVSN